MRTRIVLCAAALIGAVSFSPAVADNPANPTAASPRTTATTQPFLRAAHGAAAASSPAASSTESSADRERREMQAQIAALKAELHRLQAQMNNQPAPPAGPAPQEHLLPPDAPPAPDPNAAQAPGVIAPRIIVVPNYNDYGHGPGPYRPRGLEMNDGPHLSPRSQRDFTPRGSNFPQNGFNTPQDLRDFREFRNFGPADGMGPDLFRQHLRNFGPYQQPTTPAPSTAPTPISPPPGKTSPNNPDVI